MKELIKQKFTMEDLSKEALIKIINNLTQDYNNLIRQNANLLLEHNKLLIEHKNLLKR